jgi:chromosome condensin MukBEF MukE localization factor
VGTEKPQVDTKYNKKRHHISVEFLNEHKILLVYQSQLMKAYERRNNVQPLQPPHTVKMSNELNAPAMLLHADSLNMEVDCSGIIIENK